MLTDSMSFDAHAVVLRSKPLSFSTSFEDEDGSTIAKMSQKCFSLGSQIQWGRSTYMSAKHSLICYLNCYLVVLKAFPFAGGLVSGNYTS